MARSKSASRRSSSPSRSRRRRRTHQQQHARYSQRATPLSSPSTTVVQSSSGCLSGCWRCLRTCMCTTGWFSVVVALVATGGLLLSLYSSSGCQFLVLQVGFTPSNAAWNQSSRAELGLFYYHNTTTPTTTDDDENKTYYRDMFHESCDWYTDPFDDAIIRKDRTWTVARTMATIAACASLVATITVWLIVLFPIPINWIWPCVLLPATMVTFIAEGSKFLLFDISACRNAIWFPSGVASLPEEAQSCTLGQSAYYAIGAAALHLTALLCICLKQPSKRKLNPDFGVLSYVDHRRQSSSHRRPQQQQLHQYSSNSALSTLNANSSNHRHRSSKYNNDEEDPASDVDSILDEEIYTSGPPTMSPDSSMLGARTIVLGGDDEDDDEPGGGDGYDSVDNSSSAAVTTTPAGCDSTSSSTTATTHTAVTTTTNHDDNDPCTVTKPAALPASTTQTPSLLTPVKVSESRMAVMSKLELAKSSDCSSPEVMLKQLVLDLDNSLTDSEVPSSGGEQRS